MIPALLMRMSIEPSSRTVSATSSSHTPGWETSPTAWVALAPAARTAAHTSSIPVRSLPCTTTLAPASASPTAMPAPRPLCEPVTSAFFPFKLNAIEVHLRLASRPDPPPPKLGCTFTTPNWRSSFSRCAAMAHRNTIRWPGTATLGW